MVNLFNTRINSCSYKAINVTSNYWSNNKIMTSSLLICVLALCKAIIPAMIKKVNIPFLFPSVSVI